jgi:hypothetical protein
MTEASMHATTEIIETTEAPRRPKKLQPRRETLKQLGVCSRTPERWEKDPAVGFPQPAYINGRKYDDPDAIAAFIESRIQERA